MSLELYDYSHYLHTEITLNFYIFNEIPACIYLNSFD